MESVQTSLFQRFGAESELLARHRAGKPVSVKSNVNQGSGEGPATLASKPSCPVLTHCIHTVGSRPSGTANRWADKARPSLHGPARNDVESLATTPSPLKERTTLTAPTTAAGSRRPPASAAHPHPPVVRAPSEPPPKPNKDDSLHRIPHGLSGTGIPAEAGPMLGTNHGFIAERFHGVGMGSDSLPTGGMKRQP